MSYNSELNQTLFLRELSLVSISLGVQSFVAVILFGAIREPALTTLAFLGVNAITGAITWIGRRRNDIKNV